MDAQEDTVTKDDCEQMIREAGGTVCKGATFEDGYVVMAFSVESYGAATYGHPRYAVQFFKDSRFLNANLNGKSICRILDFAQVSK